MTTTKTTILCTYCRKAARAGLFWIMGKAGPRREGYCEACAASQKMSRTKPSYF